jgi:hypothetical protein
MREIYKITGCLLSVRRIAKPHNIQLLHFTAKSKKSKKGIRSYRRRKKESLYSPAMRFRRLCGTFPRPLITEIADSAQRASVTVRVPDGSWHGPHDAGMYPHDAGMETHGTGTHPHGMDGSRHAGNRLRDTCMRTERIPALWICFCGPLFHALILRPFPASLRLLHNTRLELCVIRGHYDRVHPRRGVRRSAQGIE